MNEINQVEFEKIRLASETMELQKNTTSILLHLSDQIAENATLSVRKVEENNSLSSHAASLSAEGLLKMQDLVAQMDEIVEAGDSINNSAMRLTNLSKETIKILEVLVDISKKTNMLALNASIEAARAGEYSRGFEVVASEVKKLDESSSRNAKEVGNILAEISTEITYLVKASSIGNTNGRQGKFLIENTKTTFEKINQTIEQVSANNESISFESTEIAHLSHKIRQTSQEISKNRETISRGLNTAANYLVR